MAYKRQSGFGKGAKIDDSQIIALVWYFCQGLPVSAIASVTGISVKTVRLHYLALRDRLQGKAFARWHEINREILTLPDPKIQSLVKATFFDVMEQCYADKNCYRNYHYGKRKNRLCKSCPLIGKFTSHAHIDEALTLIDLVRNFYAQLDIRNETDKDPVHLFRLRLIHTVTVLTARNNSRKQKNGHYDPLEKTHKSLGTLLDILLEDLAETL